MPTETPIANRREVVARLAAATPYSVHEIDRALNFLLSEVTTPLPLSLAPPFLTNATNDLVVEAARLRASEEAPRCGHCGREITKGSIVERFGMTLHGRCVARITQRGRLR